VTSSRGVPSYLKMGVAESISAEEDHDFCFVSVQLEPFEIKVYSHRICSFGVADFQPCLK